MNIKILNKKSYTMLLICFICYIVSSIISAIMIFAVASNIAEYMADLGVDAASSGVTEEEFSQVLNMLKVVLNAFAVISLIICTLIFVYFMIRINKNKKVAQGQKYITVLQVVSILSIIFGVFGLMGGNFAGLFTIGIYIVVLVACSMQKKYIPPIEESGMYGAPPYGNPYGNPNPYGAPNGYPYPNQNPYGTPPSSDPYANQPNQNPYDPNNNGN